MQKQALLSQLSAYLNGSDNVKKVINSPCLDFSSGKMLSYDGTKVWNSNSRYRRGRRGTFDSRGRNDRNDNATSKKKNQQRGNSRGGQSKKAKANENVRINLK